MCDPVSASMAVMSAGSTYSDHQQAKYTNAINKANAQRNNETVTKNYHRGLTDSQFQLMDLQKEAASNVDDASLMAMQAADSASVRAGASGVTGNSVSAILADIKGQGADAMFNIDRNMQSAQSQLQRDQWAARGNAASQLYTPQKVKSNAGQKLLLGAADAGFNAYDVKQQQKRQQRTQSKTTGLNLNH